MLDIRYWGGKLDIRYWFTKIHDQILQANRYNLALRIEENYLFIGIPDCLYNT